MIELKHIDKYYNIGTVNEVCLFKDFNLTVDDGDFISVIEVMVQERHPC